MPNTYIEECVTSRHTVKVITVNGFQMYGSIIDHNENSIILLCGRVKKLVFKHAISTIEPAKKIESNVCQILPHSV